MTNALAPRLVPAETALLVSFPHSGTALIPGLADRLTPAAARLPDTDWFVDRLYGWAGKTGAGLLTAAVSRYVVDLNRPPDNAPLYGAADTRLMTGVVPRSDFDGHALYRPGCEPDGAEVERRIRDHWQPYHVLLSAELERIVGRHGYAVLLDAHSIRHCVPLLFEGRLPDLNLGSDDGRSASPALLEAARNALESPDFQQVVNGRFKGGYITRHYGRPRCRVHALQLEIAQPAYMQETPPRWSDDRARPLQDVLRRFVGALLAWTPDDR